MIKRAINRYEIEDAVIAGEIIEEYPDDKYFPSCLVYGKTRNGRDLHIQMSLLPAVVIITVYEPDESFHAGTRAKPLRRSLQSR